MAVKVGLQAVVRRLERRAAGAREMAAFFHDQAEEEREAGNAEHEVAFVRLRDGYEERARAFEETRENIRFNCDV